MRDKVTRQCPQTTNFEEKGESKQIRTEVPLLTSLIYNALPLGQTGSLLLQPPAPFVGYELPSISVDSTAMLVVHVDKLYRVNLQDVSAPVWPSGKAQGW